MMNRRGFLQSLIGSAIAAHQLDIEKLLWIPGEKKIFIPPPPKMVTIRWGLRPMWQPLNKGILPEKYFVEQITLDEFRRRYPAFSMAV